MPDADTSGFSIVSDFPLPPDGYSHTC